METVAEIENKMDELKWKALPFFERVVNKKDYVQDKKYYTKKRLQELRWFNLSCNVSLIMFAIFNVYLAFNDMVSEGMQWFFLFVLVIFVAQKIELMTRYSYLKEVRWLKHIKKEIHS